MKMNERIHARHKELELTRAVLAKLVGVSRVTVTRWELGGYEPNGSDLQVLVAVPKCNPHRLISDNDDLEAKVSGLGSAEIFEIKEISVLPWVQAGKWTESGQSVTADDVSERVYMAANLCNEGFVLKVRGGLMTNPSGASSTPEGSLAVVDPNYGSTYEADGKMVVAQIMGSTEATLKKFAIDGSIKYLVPLNPNYRVFEVNGSCGIVGVVR